MKKKLDTDIIVERGREYTRQEVADIFGVKQERIRQIEARAMLKLRHPSHSKHLKELKCESPQAEQPTVGHIKKKLSLEQLEEYAKYWPRVI